MRTSTISHHAGYLALAALGVALLPILIGADLTKSYAHYILLGYIALGASVYAAKRSLLVWLSPNSLVFFYITISLLLGAIAFNSGKVLVLSNLLDFAFHRYTGAALSFILVGLLAMPLVDLAQPRAESRKISPSLSTSRLVALLLVTVPFLLVDFDLSAVGGAGSLNLYIISLLSIATIFHISKYGFILRYTVYLATMLILVVLFSDDKRVAVFLIFSIAFLEARRGFLVFNLRTGIIAILLTALMVLAILVMSINRGYGGFIQDEGVLVSAGYLKDYIGSDFFVAAFFQNIEVSYLFFHYFNAAELVMSGQEDLQYGFTLIKPLFLPFSRDLIPWKPDSIIDLYTLAHDPGFRYRGGSWPPNFAAEYMWNFHVFGIFLFPIFSVFNAKLYSRMLESGGSGSGYRFLLKLYVYQNVLTYARGSGVDLFVFIILVSGVFILLSAVVHSLLFEQMRDASRGSNV